MLALACGYLFVLLPAVLLPLGLAARLPALGFLVVVLLGTVVRAVFGDMPGTAPEWSEGIATFLERLPAATAVTYLAGMARSVLYLYERHSLSRDVALVDLGASMWAVFMFATCLAHELLHRADRVSRTLGRLLAGMTGYPLLEAEHLWHHHHVGDSRSGECAAPGESVWHYSARRLQRILAKLGSGEILRSHAKKRSLGLGLLVSSAATAATAAAFTWALGPRGLVLYAIVAVVLVWSQMVITYIQHWGLGSSEKQKHPGVSVAWEDGCKLQYWLTMGISFHQAHHRSSSVAYYRLHQQSDSPKAPAGYFILFFASLIPPLWQKLMRPALERWRTDPRSQKTAGRKLICIQASHS